MISANVLTTGGVDLLTCPAGKNFAVVTVFLVNYGASPADFTMYAVPSGGSPQDANLLAKARSLEMNDTFSSSNKILLGPGDKLHAKASANATINAVVTYASY